MPALVSQDNLTELVAKAACPRCGYDLRGAIDTWTDSCPLINTCSECGLEFNWSEILRPEKYEPLWCVEFRKAGWFPLSALKTILMSFRPWRFWHELKMSHDIHWRRIRVYLVLLVLPIVSLYVLEQGAFAVRTWQIINQMTAAYPQQAAATVAMNQRMLANAEASGTASEEYLNQLRRSIRVLQTASTQTPVINHSLLQAIVEAVFMPLAPLSSGSISYTWGLQSYPAPRDIHAFVLNMPLSAIGGPPVSYYYLERLVKLPLLILPLFIGIPLGFLLLPMSRRRAKVRWRHIGRVTMYSLFLPIVIVYPVSILIVLALTVPGMERLGWQLNLLLTNTVLWMALLAWWIFAIRNYLKIPHGWFVAPILAFLTVLLIALIGAYGLPLLGF